MSSHGLILKSSVIFCLIFFFSTCIAFEISHTLNGQDSITSLERYKRQIEDLSEDNQPAENAQDEPSFWDRVIRVALKMFSRFIEWLNSS